MPPARIRLPFLAGRIRGATFHELQPTVAIRTASGAFIPLTFLFDTGTQLTTVPLSLARAKGIPFSLRQSIGFRGTTSSGHGFLAPLWFSFPQLPQWQFESACCFTPDPIPRLLLSLADLIRHFTLRTTLPTPVYPHGGVVLRLRPDHGGQPRP
jgi:hypothetical protein